MDPETPDYYSSYIKWDKLYLEMVIVFDTSMYRKNKQDTEALQRYAAYLMSLVNSLYHPLNIKVALTDVIVWKGQDGVTMYQEGERMLNEFAHYRAVNLVKAVPNDVAVLITDVSFGGGVVGKALQGTMCSAKSSVAIITDHSPNPFAVAATVAHELGHNFGLEHDKVSCKCPSRYCIMASTSNGPPSRYWSSCSLEYLSWALSHGSDYCLTNKPKVRFGSPLCGNGFVDEGEQCDCGLPDVCDNHCCNATTCRFSSGSVCANGDCCDIRTCQLKPVATLCRTTKSDCDLPEFCDGKSEECPTDTYRHDGSPCKGSEAYCFENQCLTRDDQCRVIWGSTGSSAALECYTHNTRGDQHGNCGMNRINNSFQRCLPKDVFCGLLQCQHKNEKTVLGSKSIVELGFSIRSTVMCHTAMIDLGQERDDPGFVPNGAACGDDMVCVHQQCVPLKTLVSNKSCLNDCHYRGVCNNFGHCHCDAGYGGVDCGIPGVGGSIDSGPASTESAFNIGLGILLFLVVVLPVLTLVLTLLYRKGYLKPKQMAISRCFRKSSQLFSCKNGSSKFFGSGAGFHRKPTSTRSASSRKNLTLEVSLPIEKNVYSKNKPPSAAAVAPAKQPNSWRDVGSSSDGSQTSRIIATCGTMPRQPSIRPKVPAPPRPPQPCRLAGERIYSEVFSDWDDEESPPPSALKTAPSSDSFLNEVLKSLPPAASIIPCRRAPPPPTSSVPVPVPVPVPSTSVATGLGDAVKSITSSSTTKVPPAASVSVSSPSLNHVIKQTTLPRKVSEQWHGASMTKAAKGDKPQVAAVPLKPPTNCSGTVSEAATAKTLPRLMHSISSGSSSSDGQVLRPRQAPPPPPNASIRSLTPSIHSTAGSSKRSKVNNNNIPLRTLSCQKPEASEDRGNEQQQGEEQHIYDTVSPTPVVTTVKRPLPKAVGALGNKTSRLAGNSGLKATATEPKSKTNVADRVATLNAKVDNSGSTAGRKTSTRGNKVSQLAAKLNSRPS